MTSVELSIIYQRIRDQVRKDGIKLWEEPYVDKDGDPQEPILEYLGKNYSELLGLPEDRCTFAIRELQDYSLTKLRDRERFQKTGLARLKFRVPKQNNAAKGGIGTDILTIDIKLTETGQVLREKFASETNQNPRQIKLLAAGKQVDDAKALQDQGIVNNSMLIALIVPEGAKDEVDIYERVKKIKSDARNLDTNSYFSLEDQDGKKVYLPTKEREALVMGLALYKKGRTCLGRQNFAEALILFIEADEQFSNCQSKLLEAVDNYALLNLDIVWCYLCLKNITQLPDAERRLALCEKHFRQSYGENFDRVIALKGGDGNERALILRLHLLQAILAYHVDRTAEAQNLLALAESELRPLLVDEQALMNLIEMGFSLTEARIGLRAASNNIDRAVVEITQRRDRKDQARRKAREEDRFLDGNTDVNPRALMTLLEMGFEKPLAALALRKTDNTVEQAVLMLQEKRADLEKSLSKLNVDDFMRKLSSELEKQGIDFSKTAEEIAQALAKSETQQEPSTSQGTTSNATEPIDPNTPGPSTSTAPSLPNHTIKKLQKVVKKELATQEAYDRFREDFDNDEDEYLDLPLAQEEQLINEYKGYLNM